MRNTSFSIDFSQVNDELDWAVVAAFHVGVVDNVDDTVLDSLGYHEIVESPADVSCPCICTIAPICVAAFFVGIAWMIFQ